MTEVAERRRTVLVFEVGGRRHGLPVAAVRELLRVVTIVPLPQSPGLVEGVINFRGTIVPVLDIRACLKMPPKPAEVDDQLIVLETGGRPAAIRVDRVLELMSPDDGDAGPSDGDAVGVAKSADGLVVMLDGQGLVRLAGPVAEGLGADLVTPRGEGGAS